MPTLRNRYIATLSTLRPGEVHVARDGRLSIEIVNSTSRRIVELGPRITVGATKDNDIRLNDPEISRLHCELVAEEAGARVRDLQSKNGTWTGGVRIESGWLPVGGSIRVGAHTLTLRSTGSVDVPVSTEIRFGSLLGHTAHMGELFALLTRLVELPADVLVTGETGAGKSLAARELHSATHGSGAPLVVADCSCLHAQTAEAALFGNEDIEGMASRANGGTLVLDEIGELPINLQAKIATMLSSRLFHPCGALEASRLNCRVVATTSEDLLAKASERQFNPKLYFQLSGVAVHLPALRERGSADIDLLFRHFLSRQLLAGAPLSVTGEAMKVLFAHAWPGNVRELSHVAARAAVRADGRALAASDLGSISWGPGSNDPAAAKLLANLGKRPWQQARHIFGRLYVEQLIAACDGNRSEAARRAGTTRATLLRLLRSRD